MSRVVVVGGGVMGAGSAWRCAERGLDVTVVAPKRGGAEASWAAAGMLAPHAEIEFYEDELLALGDASQSLWPEFAAQVEAASGASVGYDSTGSIVVAIDRDEAEANARLFAYQRSRGLPVETWDGDRCREVEPLLSPRVHSGVWSPYDHQVDAQALVEGVRSAAANAGAAFVEGRVDAVRVAAGEVAGVTLEDGQALDADIVIVAAGAWSRALGGLSLAPPVRPVKGQMLSVRVDPALPLRYVIRGADAYVVPKVDRWVVGATSEDRGFDARVTAGGVYELLDGAYEVVPSIVELELLDTWCGFRPASRDGGPLLGASDVRGLVYCNGHYRHGIQLAPISIAAASAAVFGDPMPDAARPFDIRRFAR